MNKNEYRQPIREAVRVLNQGGVVIFPTETSYGMAADALNFQAVAHLLSIKGREPEKTLSLIVKNQRMAKYYVELEGQAKQLAKKYWPGPLTLVLPLKSEPANELSSHCIKDGQVAMRASSSYVASQLVHFLGFPIVATSANRAGQPDCYSVEQIKEQYQGHKPADYIIDAGERPQALPSTVARVINGQVEVLRQGEIKL